MKYEIKCVKCSKVLGYSKLKIEEETFCDECIEEGYGYDITSCIRKKMKEEEMEINNG